MASVSARLVIAGLIFLVGCAGGKVKKETHYINGDGKLERVEVQETDHQMAYHKTLVKMIGAMSKQKPTLQLSFKVLKVSNTDKVIIPEIKQYQRIDWESALSLIKRTPTAGENWKDGLIKGLQNLGIPLAIATMGAMHIQSARTSEEIAPDNTNVSGHDQVLSGGLDNSEHINKSFNTPVEETVNSHNTTITGSE